MTHLIWLQRLITLIPLLKAPQFNVSNVKEERNDKMTEELIKIFKSLDFKDKMEIMNCVLEKSNRK